MKVIEFYLLVAVDIICYSISCLNEVSSSWQTAAIFYPRSPDVRLCLSSPQEGDQCSMGNRYHLWKSRPNKGEAK